MTTVGAVVLPGATASLKERLNKPLSPARSLIPWKMGIWTPLGQEGKSPGYLGCWQKEQTALAQPCCYVSVYMDKVCQAQVILPACKLMQSWSSSLCCLATSGSRTTSTARGGWMASQASSQFSSSCMAFWIRVLASAVHSFPKPSLESPEPPLHRGEDVILEGSWKMSSLLRLCHEYRHFYRDLPGGGSGLEEKSTLVSTLWKVLSSIPAHLVFLSLELVKGEWVKFLQMITHTNDFMHYSSTQADVHLCLKVWRIWGIIQVSPSTIIRIQHKQGNDALHSVTSMS